MPIITDPLAKFPEQKLFESKNIAATVTPDGTVKIQVQADLPPQLTYATITRDGDPIHSGDPVALFAGYGFAVDNYPPPGVDVKYELKLDGKVLDSLVATIPSPDEDMAWVTVLDDPSIKATVRTVAPTPSWIRTARTHLSEIPGSAWRAGAVDTHIIGEQDWVIVADGIDERDKIADVFNHGIVMFRPDPALGFAPGWMIPDDLKAIPHYPYWQMNVTLVPVAAPSSFNRRVTAEGATYRAVSQEGTYRQILGNPPVTYLDFILARRRA